jgi:hypothetical protein
MICANCGAVHARSDQFCRYCGWHLGDEQPSNQPMLIEAQRALAPLGTKQALALGGAATVAAGTVTWLAMRWFARKALPALANKLPTLLKPKAKPPTAALPPQDIPHETHAEVFYYARYARRLRVRR